jgi:hypothetical protein
LSQTAALRHDDVDFRVTITAKNPLSLRRAAILRNSIGAAAMPETEAGTTIMQFGHCQLFTNRRELLADGVPVPLSAGSGRGS